MTEHEFSCTSCDDLIPWRDRGAWTCRCGELAVEYGADPQVRYSFFIKQGNIRLRGDDVALVRSLVLRTPSCMAEAGWSQAVLLARKFISRPAGPVMAETCLAHPEVVRALFSRN